MKKHISHSRTERGATLRRSRSGKIIPSVRPRIVAASNASKPGTLNLERWRPDSEDTAYQTLASALLAHDKELAKILDEVDQISKRLKSDIPDAQNVSDTLQRAVLCAVKQSLFERELRSLALTDDLTGLYNRRAFLALAGQQMKVTNRNSGCLLLFFADVDNLKQINDNYGHQEGDLALIRTGDALDQAFRSSDIIARLGGDEFAVLALEASCEHRDVILRRLRKTLNESSAAESRYELSLSVGVARFDPKHPVSLGKLIAAADEAMYEEKRNRTNFCAARQNAR